MTLPLSLEELERAAASGRDGLIDWLMDRCSTQSDADDFLALLARIRALEEGVKEAQALFALGVGAMTFNGDRANRERCIDDARIVHAKIRALLKGAEHV